MRYLRPRWGDVATVDGREFPCSYWRSERMVRLLSKQKGVPDSGFREWLPGAKSWCKPVAPEDCERVARARIADLTDVVAEHRDMLFRQRAATDPPKPRTGLDAVLDGREYPASRTTSADHVELVEPDGTGVTSHMDDLERLHDVVVHVRHANTNGGPDTRVVSVSEDGIATLRALRSVERREERFGYRELGDGWYTETSVTELAAWTEVHRDLLFPRWAPRRSGNGWPSGEDA